MCLPSIEYPLCCLRQHQGHTLGVWCIVFFMTSIQQQLPCGKPSLTGTCPPCLTDSKDGQNVVSHFSSNLCGLSSFKHRTDMPCSESNCVPVQMMGIGSWVSRRIRLSPSSFILSPARDPSSPKAEASFKFLVPSAAFEGC